MKFHGTQAIQNMIELKSYSLDGTREIECEECEAVDEITSVAKSGKVFRGIQVDKKSGESGWVPTDTGWKCPSCAM